MKIQHLTQSPIRDVIRPVGSNRPKKIPPFMGNPCKMVYLAIKFNGSDYDGFKKGQI